MLKLFPMFLLPSTARVNITWAPRRDAIASSRHETVGNQFRVVIEDQLLTKLMIFICSSRNCGVCGMNENTSHTIRLRMHAPEFETSVKF
jgi:hypothetical protein